jgi:glycosyltransferase involved in cell wall biosynthesis
MPQTLAFVYNTSKYLYRFRRELITGLQETGTRVIALVPDMDYARQLAELDVEVAPIRLRSHDLNPLSDVTSYRDIRRQLAVHNPEIIFNFTIKPVIYGSIAAKRKGVREIYSMIPGLGYIFSENTSATLLLRAVVLSLYRLSLKHNRKVFFQNISDYEYFREKRIVAKNQAVLVSGSGVDLTAFSNAKEKDAFPLILMATRLLRHKGVSEYVEAARAINRSGPVARFVLAGPLEHSRAGVSPDYLRQVEEEGVVEYVGEVDDIRPWLGRAWAVVLPSYYREGMPRILVEALAMGKPVITTDLPGCRDLVAEGENGFLVAPHSVDGLIAAVRRVVADPGLVERFGKTSRRMAEGRYDVAKVTDSIIAAMGRTKSRPSTEVEGPATKRATA